MTGKSGCYALLLILTGMGMIGLMLYLVVGLAVTLFFVLFCFLWFFPILYIVNGSLKSSLDWATNPRSFFPDFGYTLDNFKILFVGGDQGGIYDYGLDAQPITAWILNSLFASLAHTFLYLAFAILAAYVFVFLDFKGKNALFSLLLLKGGAAALSLRDTGKGACSISMALLTGRAITTMPENTQARAGGATAIMSHSSKTTNASTWRRDAI